MERSPRDPLIIEAAKPTVRLKGKTHEYGETEEFDVFESSNRTSEDLMDEERWLQDPAKDQGTWVTVDQASCVHPSGGQRGIFKEQSSDKLCIWSPSTVREWDEEGSQSAIDHCQSYRKGFRVPHEETWAFKILARACRATDYDPYHEHCKSMMDDFLGLPNSENPARGLDGRFRGVVVGLSTITCEPVAMVPSGPGANSREWPDVEFAGFQFVNQELVQRLNADKMDFANLVTLPWPYICGNGINWFSNMLIPGNIGYIKRCLWEKLSTDENTRFLQILRREHHLVMEGLGSSGVAAVLPSNEERERMPEVCRPIHEGPDYDNLRDILEWPPLAILKFPPDMTAAVQSFLTTYCDDSVPLNLALAAIIIFFDMEGKEYKHEGFEWTPVPKVSLAVFVLYFPHMLRFAEIMHLSAYINPSRFAGINYKRDCDRDFDEFEVDAEDLDIDKMREWCIGIQFQSPSIPSNYRFGLIPASMPGTSMVFPQDCTIAEEPSSDLFALCLLDDVRTYGLPSYYWEGRRGSYQMLGGPRSLFSEYVEVPTLRLQGNPKAGYWKPEQKEHIVALTGPARTVGPVFRWSGSCPKDDQVQSCAKPFLDKVGSYMYNFESTGLTTKPDLKINAETSDELHRIADLLGVPSFARAQNSKTQRPVWRGMKAQLKALQDKGELKKAATNDSSTRRAKRIKPSIRLLDPPVKRKIEEMIDNLQALSLDWDPLRDYLKSTPQPTLDGAEDAFMHVMSFISDTENAFSKKNVEKSQDSLDRVIRMAFRAAGFYDKPQLAQLNYESRWVSHKKRFSELASGQQIVDALENLYWLRDKPNEFRISISTVNTLKESPMFAAQEQAYREIRDLLKPPI